MRRRQLLAASLAGGAALAAPALVRAQGARGDARADTLRFIPQSDLTVTDPVWTTADVTRNFGFMVHDTLYGLDAQYAAHPQMVEGHTVSADGLQWDLTLREGLRFHDNTPVLARDAVASIRRWARRDGFGTALMSSTAELSAPTDRAVRFRLRAPFPLLPEALATPSSMCCIVPERLAATDPNTQMPEVVGCGPFRFLPAERVSGSRLVCARFENYVPRAEPVSFTAGGKRVHFERVVWTVQPDAATALGALSRGEFDWWENPDLDLVPTVKTTPDITVAVRDQTGEIGCMRFNSLHPPFNNEAICRLVVSAIDQGAFMQAVAGSVPELVHTGVGVLAPASPFASTAGVDTMRGPADPAALRRALGEAGYKGEPVVLLAPGNYPTINALALVGADLLRRIGFTVDVQYAGLGRAGAAALGALGALAGGVEHLLHVPGRHRQHHPRRQHRHPGQRRRRLVRLAGPPVAAGAARAVVHRAGPRGAEAGDRLAADGVLPQPVLRAARDVLAADGVPAGHRGRAGRVRAVLRGAPGGLTGGAAPAGEGFAFPRNPHPPGG